MDGGAPRAGDLEGAVAIWSPPNPQMLVAYFAANWAPTLDEACGDGRRITEVWQLRRAPFPG